MAKMADFTELLHSSKFPGVSFSHRLQFCGLNLRQMKTSEIITDSSCEMILLVLDKTLSFEKHISKLIRTVKFNLSQFRYIRHQMSTDAAKLYMHAMIFSHFTYCITSWSLSTNEAVQPLRSLYKQALKVLDKKPFSYHYCNIVKKYNLLTFENFIFFSNVSLMYKVFNNLAPPPLKKFVQKHNEVCERTTRASNKGDCYVQYRKSKFGRECFSIKAANMWNSLPTNIRECETLQQFKYSVKKWLKDNQSCNH